MHDLVFLFDVDNTLLDNDRVQATCGTTSPRPYGDAARDRYWQIFEELRDELGYADYLGALQRYRREELHDPRVLRIAPWLSDYPFAERLYEDALAAVRLRPALGHHGDPVGRRRGVPADEGGTLRPVAAFGNNVLIYIHKEECWTMSSGCFRRSTM